MSSEHKIRDLCEKVSSFPEGSKQFWLALVELRDALEEHIPRLREETADQATEKPKTKMQGAS
jgi:hypothetical protein